MAGIFRVSWGPLFSYGARNNLSFANVLRQGRAMGLTGFRRSVMLTQYRVARTRGGPRELFRQLPNYETIPTRWLGEGPEGQRRRYRYLLEAKGHSVFTGETRYKALSVESPTALTKEQVLERAWARWKEMPGDERPGISDLLFEDIELVGGRVK